MPESNVERRNPVEFPLRVAAVDMGSNALRFVAAEVSAPDEYRVLESVRVPVRLGHSAFLTQYLDADLINRAVEALKAFRRRMDDLGVEQHRAVATSAVRESRNGRELTERIWDEAEIRVEPITGAEEGRLIWRAIGSRVPLEGRRWILADLGGGSVEVSLTSSRRLAWTESLTLISQTHAPDADYELAASEFTPEELVKLTLLIGVINTWNRISIGFRSVHPGEKKLLAAA